MKFVFDIRASDSPFVEVVWGTQSEGGGSFISSAVSTMEMVITKQEGVINVTVRGPETKASAAPIPDDAEFFGIKFKLGTFMPHLPASELVDGGINLPGAANKSFWLHGSAWQFPNFENADTFVNHLIHEGLLVHESVVEATLQGQVNELSVRSVQRRFLRATGLTYKAVHQIERAHEAAKLLEQGVPILDVVDQQGFADQPHLTRSLKHFVGRTPAEILRSYWSE